jgi:hypothetical protein
MVFFGTYTPVSVLVVIECDICLCAGDGALE